MMPMSISGFNARTAYVMYSPPVTQYRDPPTQPALAPAQAAATPATQKVTHGVRTVGKELGEVKDPTWKLQQLIDGKIVLNYKSKHVWRTINATFPQF